MAEPTPAHGRRDFLRMLLASPALPYLALPSTVVEALAQEPFNEFREGPPTEELITSASEAMTVFDFEAVARKKLNYGHVASLAGTEDEATYRANRTGFDRYQLRGRRLTGINRSKIDMSRTIAGTNAPSPIIICPCGGLSAFHPAGEAEVARGVKAKGNIQALSGASSKKIEEVVAARGAPVWNQLYSDPDWNKTRAMLRRAEAAGSTVCAWTVDGSGLRTIVARARRKERQFCGNCHKLNPKDYGYNGIGSGAFPELGTMGMRDTPPLGPPMIDDSSGTWDYVKRLKDATKMKIFVKGILTREDAELAIQHGADGVWISNHGGRAENTGRGTIECLPEVVAGVNGRVPIVIDGGFRKGSDIFKALVLGATVVGIGRPYIWGLAAFGHEGVETVLDILDAELRMVISNSGAMSLATIPKTSIMERPDWRAR